MNINDDDVPTPIPAYLDQLINNNGVPRQYPGEDIEDFRMRLVQHLINTLGDSITDEQAFQMANDIIQNETSQMSKVKYDQQVNNLMVQNKVVEEQDQLRKDELNKKMQQIPNKKDLMFKKIIDFMGKYRYNIGREKKYFDLIKEAQSQNEIKELDNIDEYTELQDFLHNVILDDKRNKDIITYDDISDLMDNFTYVGKEEPDDDDYYGGRRKRRTKRRRSKVRRTKSQKRRRSKTQKKRKVKTQKRRKVKTQKKRTHKK